MTPWPQSPSYYLVEPGGLVDLGQDVVMDTSCHPPKIEVLHIRLLGWTRDALMCVYPAFIISETIARQLAAHGLTGWSVADLKLTIDEQFELVTPGADVPPLKWLKVHGKLGQEDFCLNSTGQLLLSARAKNLLILRGYLAGANVSELDTT